MAEPETIQDTIIVGGGISGLSAAKLLHERGHTVLVLEARDRVGGRTYTVKDDYFKYTDLGGSYIGPTQNRVIRLSKELGIENYKIVQTNGDILMYTKGFKWIYNSVYPTIQNPLVYMDINNFCRKLDEMCSEIPNNAPWKCAQADHWDSKTVKEFIDENCWTTKARDFAYIYVRIAFASEPAELSLLYFLWYICCCDGFERNVNSENGGQERKLVGGSMQLSERMKEKLGKGKVVLDCQVTKLCQENDMVSVTTSNGEIFKAKYIILALAPTLLHRISFSPALSPLKSQLIQRYPMGSCIKTITFYKEPFWKNTNYGKSSSYSHSDGVVSGIIDDTKPDGTLPSLTGFINGLHARKYASYTMEERKKIVTEFYADIFENEEALHPQSYVDKNWLAEVHSGGCYVGVVPPGVLTSFGRVLREPHGHIFFAGTETATAWSGYMEGAIQAGERAAREVLFALGEIGNSEIWLEEPESQEIPTKPFPDSWLNKHLPSVPGFLKLISFLTVGGLVACALYKRQDRVEALLSNLKTFDLKI